MADTLSRNALPGDGPSLPDEFPSVAGPSSRVSASARATASTLTGFRVLATGSYAPPEAVTNEALGELGYDADWIVQRTGIRARRRVAETVSASDLAYEAARACLDAADATPEEIDLILVATMTPDHKTPSTACLLQARLGATAPAMDLNAACSGFVYAMVTGGMFLQQPGFSRVLVVGTDVMSHLLDPEDRKTFPLFGDGAGAALLGKGSSSQGALAYELGADGTNNELLIVPAGGSREPASCASLEAKSHFLRMDGRPVFKWAVRTIRESCERVLREAGVAPEEVDLVVLHQANQRILDAASSELGFLPERNFMNLDRYGNTSAGSIPLALDEAAREGRIGPGSRVLLCGFGAGLTWGTMLLRW
ncbi:MAG TPA: beta-ketoacyl-ACP synthase III [Pirellulaceae bacterium]|jgi:3-oxoacyl-[acyl-carrier-protein] synthase-3|nr:beta-ketoacyl-ACP synthase III [Pirellulaceae bacterium]